MSGKTATAPCGHPGETIIGTFVKCLQGCDSKSSAKAAPRRGEPRHVPDCACKRCDVRRRTVAIKFRTKDGIDYARVPWDGASNPVWTSPASGELRHWVLVDADGLEVASKLTDVSIPCAGLEMETHVSVMLDLLGLLQVQLDTKQRPLKRSQVTIDAPQVRAWTFNCDKLLPKAAGTCTVDLVAGPGGGVRRDAVFHRRLGSEWWLEEDCGEPLAGGGGTAEDLRAAAMQSGFVRDVRITEPHPGQVLVEARLPAGASGPRLAYERQLWDLLSDAKPCGVDLVINLSWDEA